VDARHILPGHTLVAAGAVVDVHENKEGWIRFGTPGYNDCKRAMTSVSVLQPTITSCDRPTASRLSL
jgi:hypothetical protein